MSLKICQSWSRPLLEVSIRLTKENTVTSMLQSHAIFFVALSHTGSGRSWTEPSDTPTIRIYSAPHPWYIIYWWSFTGTGASITLSIRTTASAVRTGYSAIRRRRTWWRNICRATTGARWPSPPSVTCPGNSIFLCLFHRAVFSSTLLTARESRALLESRML